MCFLSQWCVRCLKLGCCSLVPVNGIVGVSGVFTGVELALRISGVCYVTQDCVVSFRDVFCGLNKVYCLLQ